MRIYLSPPHQSGRELSLLQEVLDSNYLAPVGPMLDRFEAQMRVVSGFRHALALNSGHTRLDAISRDLGTDMILDSQLAVKIGNVLFTTSLTNRLDPPNFTL